MLFCVVTGAGEGRDVVVSVTSGVECVSLWFCIDGFMRVSQFLPLYSFDIYTNVH